MDEGTGAAGVMAVSDPDGNPAYGCNEKLKGDGCAVSVNMENIVVFPVEIPIKSQIVGK